MGYCRARLARDRKEAVYRAYITDAVAAIAENTQRFAGGKSMQRRYTELVKPQREPKQSSADVIARIKKKLRD